MHGKAIPISNSAVMLGMMLGRRIDSSGMVLIHWAYPQGPSPSGAWLNLKAPYELLDLQHDTMGT